MGREIKFRAKDRTGKWNYGHYHFSVMYPNDIANHHIDNEIIDVGTLGQYTGLKDANRVEIYENDICIHLLKPKIKGIISFFEGSFIIGVPVTWNSLIHFNCPKYIEIIGNIHDNPELLA